MPSKSPVRLIRKKPVGIRFPEKVFKNADVLETALAFAASGFYVVPVRITAEGKKTPLIAWSTETTLDVKIIRRWFEKDFPGADMAIVTGKQTGLVVIDVDQKNGKDGRASFEQLKKKYRLPEDTLIVQTPSGGRHYYYAYPQD